MLARQDLEALLRTRKLDHTLSWTTSASERRAPDVVPTGLDQLDRHLHGGFPRGQLSEIVGARSTGRTGLLCALLAAATRRGELVALIDTLDMFDPISGAAAGIDLSRVLWTRGTVVSGAVPRTAGIDARPHAAVRRALKATSLVLQSGDFGVVALDLADVPSRTMRQIPFTTWRRLQRLVEGSQTACVLIAGGAVARGPDGLTLTLQPGHPTGHWTGVGDHRLLSGLTANARVIRGRMCSRDPGPIELVLRPPCLERT